MERTGDSVCQGDAQVVPSTTDTGQGHDTHGKFAKGNQFGRMRQSAPKRITLLRQMLDEAIVRAGGQAFVDAFIEKYPVEAMKIRAMLEPKDIRLDVESRSVRIVMFAEPTNGKALPGDDKPVALPLPEAQNALTDALTDTEQTPVCSGNVREKLACGVP